MTLRNVLNSTALVAILAASVDAGESPWYVNVKLGQGSLDARFNAPIPMHFEGHDETGDVELGYVVNRYFAVQAGYHDLGEYRGYCATCFAGEALASSPLPIGPVTADVSGLSLAVVPRWLTLADRLTVFGKLGVFDWDFDVDGLGLSLSDRELLSGLGIRYDFRKGLGVLVEHQRLGPDVDSTSVGASWRF